MPSSFYHFSPFRHHPGTAQLHFLSSERKKGTGATLIRKSGMRQPFHYPLPHIRPQYLALLPQRPYRKSPDGSRNDKGLRVMDGKFRKGPLRGCDNRALAVRFSMTARQSGSCSRGQVHRQISPSCSSPC